MMPPSHLLFLPGMMCDARLFSPQKSHFQDKYEVQVRAYGTHRTIEEIAQQQLLDAPQSFALAGLSMGGIVAMEMIRQAPQRITHLALMDTNPLAETDRVAHRREPQIQAARDGHLSRVMRDEMKPNYLADGPNKGEILDLCMQMALDLGPAAFERQSRALQTRPDQCGTLRKVEIPTLILCGRHDTLCPLARHELMAELIPGAHLEVIDDAGHLPTLESPAATNAALARWLDASA